MIPICGDHVGAVDGGAVRATRRLRQRHCGTECRLGAKDALADEREPED